MPCSHNNTYGQQDGHFGPDPALRLVHPSSREQQIVALRAQGLTLAEIGRRHGLSRQRVAQIIDESNGGRVPRSEVVEARRAGVARASRDRSREIIELYREGLSVGEIHQRVDVSWNTVRAMVAELASDEDRGARRDAQRSRPGHPAPRFSDEYLLDGVRLVAQQLGHPPTGREYEQLAAQLRLASTQTVYARFGGWTRALRAAGFDAREVKLRSPRWDIASCWRALVSVSDLLGDPPRYHRYLVVAASRDDLPSGSTLTLRLGLWPEIVAALRAHARLNGTVSSKEAAA